MGKELSITRDHSAAMKGLLICLVVLGHNRFFCDVFPQSYWNWLYCFHVACFFILPFFYQEHTFSWSRVLTNAKRLLWPYTYMFGVLFLMDWFILKETTIDFGLFRTYLTGDFYKLKNYIGFQYLWFLPAMFSMLAIKDAYTSVNNVVKRILIVVGGAFFVLFWIFLYHQPYAKIINPTLSQFAVFSFMLGFAMFFLGWCTRKIIERFSVPSWLLILAMAVFLAALVLTINTSYSQHTVWISRALCPVLGFAFLFQWNGYNYLVLRKIGVLSLPIYLFHQPINFFLWMILKDYNITPSLQLFFSYLATLFLSYLVAKMVVSFKFLNRLLFAK